ncbi:MAG: right-handed parallel beta-helix repeat-containing protein [Parvibaculaceae bacterium]
MLTGLGRLTATIAVATAGFLAGNGATNAGLGAGATPNWEPWFEAGGYVSNRNDRGEAVGWAPIAQDGDELLFVDVRGKLFEGGSEEGNFALGYRDMRSDGWNFGVWGGFDVRTSENGNTFQQISGGLEALSADWDVRLNGYYPLDDNKSVGAGFVSTSSSSAPSGPTLDLIGSQLFFVRGTATTTTTTVATAGADLAAWGVDGEVGRRAPLEEWLTWVDPINDAGDRYDHEARVFLGAFYFDNSLFPEPIWGPRLRTEWRLNDVITDLPGSRLTLEAEAQYDDVRKDQFEVGLRLRIPLGTPDNYTRGLSAQAARMTEGLERDTDIVTQSRTGSLTTSTTTVVSPTSLEPVKDPATNVDLDSVAFIDTPGTAQAEVTAAGANALVVLQGGNGNFAEIDLQVDQSLVGGSNGILVEGRSTGVQDTYVAPGAAATLYSLAEGGILTMANNTHATGLIIESDGSVPTVGVETGTSTNVFVDYNVLRNLDLAALRVASGGEVTFANNAASNVNFDGATIGSGSTVVLRDNVWTSIGQNVVEVDESVALTFSGNRLEGTSATNGATASVFRFDGGAPPVTIVDGTGNINNLVNTPTLCDTAGAATFTGTIDLGGVSLTDNVVPCN